MKTLLLFTLLLFSGVAMAGECKALLDPLLQADEVKDASVVFKTCGAEAERGDAEALYYMSHFYFGFGGVEMDVAKAVAAATLAAEKGYPQAQHWMGWQHETGAHLKQDQSPALRWYVKAAESNYWMALDRLYLAYRDGDLGLEADAEKSNYYLELRRKCKCK